MVNKEELPQTFDLFKQYMKPVIENSLGWDEGFQNSGFKSRLLPEWFYWVEINKERVGLVCFKTLERTIHIHLLIIFAPHQGNGYGELVTNHIRHRASEENKSLTLSCFKNNEPAVSLYKKLKFRVKSEDNYFFHFSSDRIST